jgi:hypothetical protein
MAFVFGYSSLVEGHAEQVEYHLDGYRRRWTFARTSPCSPRGGSGLPSRRALRTPREAREVASMLNGEAGDVERASPSFERCAACDGRGVVAPADALLL